MHRRLVRTQRHITFVSAFSSQRIMVPLKASRPFTLEPLEIRRHSTFACEPAGWYASFMQNREHLRVTTDSGSPIRARRLSSMDREILWLTDAFVSSSKRLDYNGRFASVRAGLSLSKYNNGFARWKKREYRGKLYPVQLLYLPACQQGDRTVRDPNAR